jgi:D-threo-aldose 1-dehydrogenase
VKLPPIIFGTSCLGNLYEALPWEAKLAILQEIFTNSPEGAVLDSAGKYGAGLALEVIGKGLRELGIPPGKVTISNKLGWLRVPLRGAEPTFETGVWAALEHDAEQSLGYEGILRCFAQGCLLLGETYTPRLVSVHDPDEYLAKSDSSKDRRRRSDDILQAYRALADLKRQGKVASVGIGVKDWTVSRDIAQATELDWVMLACSLTVMSHPPELLSFIRELERRGIRIINSAVFHSGFLTIQKVMICLRGARGFMPCVQSTPWLLLPPVSSSACRFRVWSALPSTRARSRTSHRTSDWCGLAFRRISGWP